MTINNINKELCALASTIGFQACICEAMPASGSERRYFRLKDNIGKSIIGVFGSDVRENKAFISLAKYFASKSCLVPIVLAISDDCRFYLQSDLGDESLFDILHSSKGDKITEECMRNLARIQTLPIEDWQKYSFNSPFGHRLIMWDLNYFKYMFLKQTSSVFNEDLLEDDFVKFSEYLSGIPIEYCGFMYRDCQSRNIMIHKDAPYWIDFQGGRVGPCVYDVVSFLWQAKAGFTREEREKLLNIYADELIQIRHVNKTEILKQSKLFALFRTLQVLGAYGYRGLIQKKAHFVTSIPLALDNLRDLINDGALSCFSELDRVCREIVNDARFLKNASAGVLTVEVFSFSYKKGYPEDLSGNGGGFMFDCRALHNPGRYDQYKQLTGLDDEVIEFLEEKGEIQSFLKSAWELTDSAVHRYLKRGFTSLQIGFGCTGGRHRSVYSAEHTAEHIAQEFPEAIVIVNHREQGIRRYLSSNK